MILPPSNLGVIGGGQLGRMIGLAARRLGYGFQVYEPTPGCPAGQIADRQSNRPYTDLEALTAFASAVDVVTFEFENIPADVLQHVARSAPIYPDWTVLHTCQNREREKNFLKIRGYPHAPFAVVDSAESLARAIDTLGKPCVLKTADFGYDGKGQCKITADTLPASAWAALAAPRGVLEGWIDYACELSVVCARTRNGEVRTFPVSENIHSHHILDLSIVPARIDPRIEKEALQIASSIADDLKVVGLLAVELFLQRDGKLLVNEMAPRPHNSGHYTLDACATSQFEQQIRAVCGLPLGSTELLSPVVMANLLGDLWSGGTPAWDAILAHPTAKLHLYGKAEARPGRKMGHFCVLGNTAESALAEARVIQRELAAHS
ncbi:MAG: 5-(carboxyamino)imidazole ribonucleotide synthase [Candidatus Methylacidiphilales bacterium]|nr:5-(carboxyamino)imidazole ribonucleotide synthase [Candidatus Methylacidiphilales bacterium]